MKKIGENNPLDHNIKKALMDDLSMKYSKARVIEPIIIGAGKATIPSKEDVIKSLQSQLKDKESEMEVLKESFNEKLEEIREGISQSPRYGGLQFEDYCSRKEVLEILDNHIKVNTKQG
jgi:N-methylhydantoinase B/oxoprolinase/acetone carboxylase alpha subunit